VGAGEEETSEEKSEAWTKASRVTEVLIVAQANCRSEREKKQ